MNSCANDLPRTTNACSAGCIDLTGGIERFVNFAGRAAAMKPDVLDKLDIDQTVDAYGDLLGVPSRLIVSTDKATAARRGDVASCKSSPHRKSTCLSDRPFADRNGRQVVAKKSCNRGLFQ